MNDLISRREVIDMLCNLHIDNIAVNDKRITEYIKELLPVEAKPVEEIYKMSESDFITYILSTICDYAKINDYDITDTVKVMGENLVALTDICTFDNWKAGADMRGGKNE